MKTTVKEFMERLAALEPEDDFEVRIFVRDADGGHMLALETAELVPVNLNGPCVQINAERLGGDEMGEEEKATITRLYTGGESTVPDPNPCYFCDVEDGNETAYDSDIHKICLICGMKLARVAEAGIEYDARGGTVAVTMDYAPDTPLPSASADVFERTVMDWIPCSLPFLQGKLLDAGLDMNCGYIYGRLLVLSAAKDDIDVVDDGTGIMIEPSASMIAAVEKEEAEDGPSSGVYKWTVSIEVAPIWVADGFILTADRLHRMVLSELRRAHSSEVEVSILEHPDALQIAAEQGERGPRDASGTPINKPTYQPLLCDTCECYPCKCPKLCPVCGVEMEEVVNDDAEVIPECPDCADPDLYALRKNGRPFAFSPDHRDLRVVLQRQDATTDTWDLELGDRILVRQASLFEMTVAIGCLIASEGVITSDGEPAYKKLVDGMEADTAAKMGADDGQN